MTGNTKVWRAPLAGLASLAMVATMGVSALTANAADVTFTFDGQGLTFDGGKDTFKVTDNGNGKLDQAEIDEAASKLDDKSIAPEWYTTASYGEKNTAVQPGETTATTVYAHWAAEEGYVVDFDDAYVTTLFGKDGKYDVLSDWQVPVDNGVNDYKVLDGFNTKDGKYTAVKPAGADLTQYSTVENGVNKYQVAFTSNYVDAYQVTFDLKDFKGETWGHADGAKLVVEVKQGAKFSDYGVVPEVVNAAGRKVTSWKENKADKTAFDPSAAVTKNVTLHPASAAQYHNVTFKVAGKADVVKSVADGEKVAQPSDPEKAATSDYKYKFVGWYNGSKKYDFSTAVSSDLTLTAKFEVTAVKLTYKLNKGQQKPVEKWVSAGDKYAAPTVSDESFAGWKPTYPTGVTLSLEQSADGESAQVYFLTADTEDETKTVKVYLSTKFDAEWDANDETLKDYESKVDATLEASKQTAYTEASYKQYLADYQEYLKAKTEAGKNGYTVSEYATLIKQIKEAQAKLVEVGDTPLYRVYNKNNGGHYFTISKKEADALVKLGWQAEGTPYKVVGLDNPDRGAALGEGVYSAYNPNSGEHLLVSEGEAVALSKVGWNNEGLKFYTVQNGSTAAYRVFNPNSRDAGSHHYAAKGEGAALVKLGWLWDNNANAVFTFDK